MRILYTVHAYKPAYRMGGPILSVSALAEGLVRKGHHVTVFATTSNLDESLDVPLNQPLKVDGVEVWYFQPDARAKRWLPSISSLSRSVGFHYCPAMGSHLTRLAPEADLIHTHIPFVYPTYAAARAARQFHKPLFYHQRGAFDPDNLRFRSLKKRLCITLIERPILRQATTLIALTEAEVASYRSLEVDTACRIVPNGIRVMDYRTEPLYTFESQCLQRIQPDSVVILFLGRLHPRKGADKLLQAFLTIHTRLPPALLVMAGPDESGLEARFRKAVGEAGASARVVFPGMVSGHTKLDLLARADIFCLPAIGEGFSMAVLEALASATPVLISPGCHFPEVEAVGAGKVVSPNTQALAQALIDLTSDEDALRAMGHRGLEFVARRYNWDGIIEELLDVYREGIERNMKLRFVSGGSEFPRVRVRGH